ncbi:type IV toxin-antitoxin system AbiEi family antitoxin domain-containing protein [Ornithinimicrobium pratense]|uniref:Type IV toxin-antitoxin system AbiEi family antitoxin domain-containing protein n=1 Tax=Ornithinimicrobium pratense TaxID=2593973 RepID=A0A5J6V4U5_9MICO|nr:type IV toxin-antitoxin system AbiEi family antitoxin domain-containing protein [Ornithinimicrobium pratense]QFG68788.1 type IV toxin-antitoxin system AbiEi family antitoxin domain-containing protein [Ornithinimicrobium pratense]
MIVIPPSPFSYAQALARGMSRREIEWLLEAGEIVRLRQGWYAHPTLDDSRTGWEARTDQHLDRLRNALASRPGHAASHTTAALLHGLAVTVATGTPVHLTTIDRVPSSRRYPGLRIHRSETVANDTELVEGMRSTGLVRTIADVLRTRTLPHGVAMLDDVLRRGLASVSEVRQVIDAQARWGGRPKAVAATHLADPGRETWGESFSFVHLHLQGQPLPLPQVAVYDAGKKFLARVDGLWPERGVVGECDGEMKYFLDDLDVDATPEETVLRHLAAEEVRQARIEATGLGVVRWSPAQVRDDPDGVARRVNRAAGQVRPDEFTGWVRWDGELRKLPFTVDRPAIDPETLRYRRRRRPAHY